MKTRILMLGLLCSFWLISCNKDDDKNSSNGSSEFISSTDVDVISDDVSQIVELESDQTASNRLTSATENFLGNCAQVTTSVSGNIVTRTIDFGTSNCTLNNGNTVRGKIILTFTNDWDATTRTINYSFENFYHNDNHVEGNRNVVKTILPSGHPQTTISLDMTVTTPSNAVYTVTGNRVREFAEGYGNNILADNVFLVHGNWTTTLPNGNTHSHSVNEESPLRIIYSCDQTVGRRRFEIVSGIATITRNNNTAVINYGDGQCDGVGTISINGGAAITFTLRR
ncbi:hypothetical protein G4D82_00930 [Flavobacterium sp. CYK-4]|uniref:hypothetical protein n=1 Tax=Flavobacterium lotistagni TaxID=2709660 RepID=UPI00140927B5|nr:hypothetical protein [Flavobacterium lotistagni]NHM05771.1 hypothetical protein [Flavobacterium lotistagni]